MSIGAQPPADRRTWVGLPVLLWLLAAAGTANGGWAEGRELRFEHLSIDQGLSQNSVFAILQDRTGFLWFGTQDGLNRFDGYRFEVLRRDPADANSLSHNHVRALHEDSGGMLWIGTRDGGLNRYDRRHRTFKRYRHRPDDPHSLSHDLVWAIHEDASGRLWVGTRGGGLSRLDDPETGRFTNLRHDPGNPRSLSDDRVRAIHEDRDRTLWLGSDKGLNRLDPDTLAVTRYLLAPVGDGAIDSTMVLSVHRDVRDRFWVGTQYGLVRFHPPGEGFAGEAREPFTYYRHDPSRPNEPSRDSVWDLHEDDRGRLWLATYGGGLLIFDPESETFIRHRHDPNRPRSLSEDKVVDLFEDRSGAFWAGTSGGGLNKLSFRTKAFEHIGRGRGAGPGLSDDMVMSIHEDRQGILWIGTWTGGLNRLDRGGDTVATYRADPDDARKLAYRDVRAILEDSRGRLWVGTERGGLHRFDRATESFIRYRHDPGDPGSLRDNDAWVLHEDRAGTLWVGTYGGGLSRYRDPDDAFSHFFHDAADPHSLSSDVVRALCEDAEGFLWVGTGGGGLNRLDPGRSGRFVRFRHATGDATRLSSDEILSIAQDRAGRLWIGTHGGGLNRLVGDPSADGAGTGEIRFRHYTEAHGLPSNVVYGILEDAEGALWMSTNRGLARFDPATETFRNYDVTDGLQSNEFNSGAYFENSRGEMFFGGIHGVNAFRPEQIRDNPFVPPVVLTSFKVFNEDVVLDTELARLPSVVLEHDQSVVSFEFAALSFTAPQKNRYAYQLSGFRDRWIELGTERDVTFTNLDPGTYTLRVRGSNDDGVWNRDGLTLKVVVEPPFWRTWWFTALSALAAAGLLLASHRLRTRRMRRHNLALKAEVAERKRAESALERLVGELETKNVELEARNAEMERFTYTLSHDLKTPLVTIKGFLGLLKRDVAAGNAERVARDVRQIAGAADRMARLLGELLELSRVGRVTHVPETVGLTRLAHEAAEMVAERIAARGVELEIEPEMPAVFGDRARLLEVFQNLIDNAVTFMGDQPAPRIEISARLRGGEVLCRVRDNGIGIDPRYHENVFGLFNRLDPDIDGTGIGLALVKRIVEVHGGRVWVESEGEGRGSTFCFALGSPRAPARTEDLAVVVGSASR